MQASLYPHPTLLNTTGSRNQIKFPQDFQVILRADRQESGNLYLGNIEAAENAAILQSLRIGAIMCVAKGRATKHPKELVKHSKYIPLEEGENVEIGQYLEEGVNFITEKLKITNVLVHCVSGSNRSACFAIAFLMRQRCLSLEDAYSEVKSRRKVICLSDRMLMQLKMFERGMNKGEASFQERSVRQEQASFRNDSAGQRLIKIKTNVVDRSNFLAVEEQSNLNHSKLTGRSLRVDDDESKSCRSNKSFNSKASNNLSALNQSKIAMRNPEESFISKHSKPPSILNKSFASRRPSSLSSSQVLELDDLPELRLEKKASSSREQFTQKIRELQSKNSVINEKISLLHQRFENETQNSRLTLETQLNQISQFRSNLCSERKMRLSRIAQDVSGFVDYVPLHTTER